MKGIRIKDEVIDHLNNDPLVLIIGHNEQYKSRLINQLLSDDAFYSHKFGRILYIGERKYKSERIKQDEKNWIEKASFEDILEKLNIAKKEKIVNLMIVFNTRMIKEYRETIAKLFAIKATYLPGIISIMVNISDLSDLPEKTLSSFNTFFFFDDEKMLKELLGISELELKRKKDVFVWSKHKLTVFKDIKD